MLGEVFDNSFSSETLGCTQVFHIFTSTQYKHSIPRSKHWFYILFYMEVYHWLYSNIPSGPHGLHAPILDFFLKKQLLGINPKELVPW